MAVSSRKSEPYKLIGINEKIVSNRRDNEVIVNSKTTTDHNRVSKEVGEDPHTVSRCSVLDVREAFVP